MKKPPRPRSSCPLSYALDFIGDKWTLVVLRDLIILRKRHFREFLDSAEGIATNILTDRLKQLERAGLVTRTREARRVVYAPTGKAMDLLPAMLEILRWGDKYFAGSGAPRALMRGIEKDRDALVAELRSKHDQGEAR